MDTIVNPFKQASIGLVKGVSALPGNVVKGVSKLGDGLTIVSDSVMENAGKIFRTNTTNPMNRSQVELNRDINAFSLVEDTQNDVSDLEILLRLKKKRSTHSNRFPFSRVQKIFHCVFFS